MNQSSSSSSSSSKWLAHVFRAAVFSLLSESEEEAEVEKKKSMRP